MSNRAPRAGGFSDDPRVLEAHLAHRHAAVWSPNVVMEEPAFLDEVGDMTGLRILDLGCGDGNFGLTAYSGGYRSWVGLDSFQAGDSR